MPNEVLIRHGYTMQDLHRITAAAVTAERLMASDVHDRYDTAWSAIAEQHPDPSSGRSGQAEA